MKSGALFWGKGRQWAKEEKAALWGHLEARGSAAGSTPRGLISPAVTLPVATGSVTRSLSLPWARLLDLHQHRGQLEKGRGSSGSIRRGKSLQSPEKHTGQESTEGQHRPEPQAGQGGRDGVWLLVRSWELPSGCCWTRKIRTEMRLQWMREQTGGDRLDIFTHKRKKRLVTKIAKKVRDVRDSKYFFGSHHVPSGIAIDE